MKCECDPDILSSDSDHTAHNPVTVITVSYTQDIAALWSGSSIEGALRVISCLLETLRHSLCPGEIALVCLPATFLFVSQPFVFFFSQTPVCLCPTFYLSPRGLLVRVPDACWFVSQMQVGLCPRCKLDCLQAAFWFVSQRPVILSPIHMLFCLPVACYFVSKTPVGLSPSCLLICLPEASCFSPIHLFICLPVAFLFVY